MIRLTFVVCCFALLGSCSSRPVPAPVTEVYQGQSYLDVEKAAYKGEKYRVKKGDTLYSIAWFSGRDFRELAKLNNIKAPYAIYPNQELRLHRPAKKTVLPQDKKAPARQLKKVTPLVDRSEKQAYGGAKVADKSTKYVNNRGILPTSVSKWVWPAKGKLIGRFSDNKLGNKGIDIAGKFDSNIVAAADGKVVYVGDALRGYGNLIIVKHSETYLSAYAHTNRILVKERQLVKAGDKIATMGNSGSDKTQLHFEVRHKGKSLDPLAFLPKK